MERRMENESVTEWRVKLYRRALDQLKDQSERSEAAQSARADVRDASVTPGKNSTQTE